MQALDPMDIMRELEPAVESNLNRHLSVAQEWMPHEYVPWSKGRDFAGDEGLAWTPDQSTLSPVAQLAFEVNLLTEDNLPSYHHEIASAFGRDGAWGTWVHRWTAEEGRHACCIRDYLLVTRAVDPIALERDRMATMEVGYNSAGKDLLEVLAYVSFQELATRIAHRNTGRMSEDPVADKLMARISTDENLHMIFYRDLISAAIELTPSQTVKEIRGQLLGFQMPGTGIKNFQDKAKKIARAGIYDLRIHHDEVVMPVLRKWNFFELEGLTPEAEQARTEVSEYVKNIEALAVHFEEKRDEWKARQAARAEDDAVAV
jgi:acyl-[acyl-carrier-protein] desaturase